MITQETKLEIFVDHISGWAVVEESIGLLHPERYPERLALRGKVGRSTVISSGKVFQVLPTPKLLPECEFCGSRHNEPFDGMCLL